MNIAEEKVYKVLLASGVENVKADDRIKEDCGLDSLSLVSVIVGLEEEIGCEFDDGDLDPSALLTVNDLISLTEKNL